MSKKVRTLDDYRARLNKSYIICSVPEQGKEIRVVVNNDHRQSLRRYDNKKEAMRDAQTVKYNNKDVKYFAVVRLSDIVKEI